jgi:putative ATP-dependent endonuclease of the OLD family
MRIVYVEIDNFRGIRKLRWAPNAKVNCLIGPGDSTKTTILDAIELALNPRSYSFADDSDFYDLDYDQPINIVVTVGGLPAEFNSDDRYGMHLRGWNEAAPKIEDEPGPGLQNVLSLRVTVDKTHEARWSLYNHRIEADGDNDPPALRYKDARHLATTRLGPYAERHLGWSRLSVLNRLGDTADSLGGQLADANRAARAAFTKGNPEVFKETAERAEKLSKHFSVPVREKYAAELDGKLPLRRLGTGSSRLIVSALQHDAGASHVALIDEIEHGLEPHRIARLLKYLSAPPAKPGNSPPSQIFITTHSPVVIRELTAAEISAVRSVDGLTEVRSVVATARDRGTAQRHLRACPDAFLARKIAVCEGRTEQGLARGLDAYWSSQCKLESFALQGAIAIDGNGNGSAPILADHLIELGYDVFLLLDSDVKVDDKVLEALQVKGVRVYEWTGGCSTEERIFLDVPWTVVGALVGFAAECVTADSVRAQINKVCKAQGLPELPALNLPAALDSTAFRSALGKAAKNEDRSWFKDITRGERLAEILGPSLENISGKPLCEGVTALRKWVDG